MKKRTQLKWEKGGSGNLLLRLKEGCISYNPNTGMGHPRAKYLTKFLNILGQNVEDGEETALFDGQVFRILTGDFRKEYEKIAYKGGL